MGDARPNNKRILAKRCKNFGEEYVSTASKKVIAKRRIGAYCKDGCMTNFGEAGVQEIFKQYWCLGDINLQNAYLIGCIRKCAIKRKRTKLPSKRMTNYQYIIHYNGLDSVFCKAGFIAMHGLREGKLRYLVTTQILSTETPILDRPIRDKNPPRNKISGKNLGPPRNKISAKIFGPPRFPRSKISAKTLELVHENIKMLPFLSNHYVRAKTPNRTYLEYGMTSDRIYSKYLEWLSDNNEINNYVNVDFFRDTLKKYNIGTAPAKTDTCNVCDVAKAKIILAISQGESSQNIKAELTRHTDKAKRAHGEMKSYQKNNDPEVLAIAINLQQTLPIPKISAGISYYKRKLWGYNLGICDLKTGKSYMHLWDETTAGRGACEVASCILNWLTVIGKNEAKKLVIFSDNCAGQNKNKILVATALRLVHLKTLEQVELKYLVSGHSFLPCDMSFDLVEKQVQYRDTLWTLDDYAQCMKHASSPNFIVTVMHRVNFLNLEVLLKAIVVRNPAQKKFSKSAQIIISNTYPEGYILKDSFEEDCSVTKVRMMPGKKAYTEQDFDLSKVQVPLKYDASRLLQKEKVKDLECLLEYYYSAHKKQWLKNIIATQRMLENTKDTVDAFNEDVAGEINDEEYTIMDYVYGEKTMPKEGRSAH